MEGYPSRIRSSVLQPWYDALNAIQHQDEQSLFRNYYGMALL
jgi:hypothetical protein